MKMCQVAILAFAFWIAAEPAAGGVEKSAGGCPAAVRLVSGETLATSLDAAKDPSAASREGGNRFR